MVTNKTAQRPNPPVFCLIIQLNILELKKYVQLYLVASRLGGEAVPVPSPFVVTRQIQAPRARMKEHPSPPPPTCQSTNVSVSPPLPWPYTLENPHGDSNWWCH